MARVTVEDCLDKIPSRFALVLVAAKRTRQLIKGADARVKSKNKPSVTSLREIAAGAVYVEENLAELLEHHVEDRNLPRPIY